MSGEELRDAVRAYADEHAKGWTLVVITAHDGARVEHSLLVEPRENAAKTATRCAASSAEPLSPR